MLAMRISLMVLRLCALLALVLGGIFWVNPSSEESLGGGTVLIHILLGVLVVFSLFGIGAGLLMAGMRNGGLAAGAFVIGLVVLLVGLTQRNLVLNSSHWVIQVVHLLLGLLAVGYGEMCVRRSRRVRQVETAQVAR